MLLCGFVAFCYEICSSLVKLRDNEGLESAAMGKRVLTLQQIQDLQTWKYFQHRIS